MSIYETKQVPEPEPEPAPAPKSDAEPPAQDLLAWLTGLGLEEHEDVVGGYVSASTALTDVLGMLEAEQEDEEEEDLKDLIGEMELDDAAAAEFRAAIAALKKTLEQAKREKQAAKAAAEQAAKAAREAKAAAKEAEAAAAPDQAVLLKVASLVRLPVAVLEARATSALVELGLDSMAAGQLESWLQERFGVVGFTSERLLRRSTTLAVVVTEAASPGGGSSGASADPVLAARFTAMKEAGENPFMDYQLPRASDLPMIETDRIVVPTPRNPLGAKGNGEAGAIGGPPAVINALVDALAPLGIEHIDMPATPMKVWQAIREAQS